MTCRACTRLRVGEWGGWGRWAGVNAPARPSRVRHCLRQTTEPREEQVGASPHNRELLCSPPETMRSHLETKLSPAASRSRTGAGDSGHSSPVTLEPCLVPPSPRKSGPKSSLHGWAQSGETQGTCAEFSWDGSLVPGDVKGSHSEPEKSQACQGTASGPHQEKPRAGRKLGRHSAL